MLPLVYFDRSQLKHRPAYFYRVAAGIESGHGRPSRKHIPEYNCLDDQIFDALIAVVDLLSGIIQRSRLAQHRLLQRGLSGGWGYSFPCNRSGGFHVIQRGRCYLRSASGVVALEHGDIVFVMRGVDHDLLSSPGQRAAPVQRLIELVASASPGSAAKKPRRAPKLSAVELLSVRYEFPDGEAHPFFRELPEIIVLCTRDLPVHDPIHQALQMLSMASQTGDGDGLVLDRLTDILLYYTLQRWLQAHPPKRPGYRSAMQDQKVAAVLDLMHSRSAHDWRLESLARSVGISRAALATRFRQTMGLTPMEYLTRLRLETGRHLLDDRDLNLEEIARQIGYSSSFAFSKAFKRVYGQAPRRLTELKVAT